MGGSEIASVVADAGDAEGFCQSAGAAGEFGEVGSFLQVYFSGSRHLLNAKEGFERTEQN